MTQFNSIEHHGRPEDISAWRPVLTGLNLMRGAILAAMFGFVVYVILLVIAIFCAMTLHVNWPSYVMFGAIGLHALVTTILLLWGMGLCCLAPSDAGAKRFAQAAFVLALTTTALAGAWLTLEVFVLSWVSQDWFNALSRFREYEFALLGVLMLNGTLAIACWARFVGAVAKNFRRRYLAKDATGFLVFFCIWTGVTTLIVSIGRFGTIEPFLVLGVLLVCGAAPLMCLATWLLFSVRDVLRKAFCVEATPDAPPSP